MRKLILLFLISLGISIPQLYCISVYEYIQREGTPEVINGILDLSNKNLTSFEGLHAIPAETLSRARILKLFGNQLRMLPDGIFNGLYNLEHLYLNSNQLRELHAGAFSGLPNLKVLILVDNQIQVLPAHIFNDLPNLEVITLDNNQLRQLPADIFSGLRNLTTLSLSHNELRQLPVTIFNDVNRLEFLNLSNNQLQVIQPVTLRNLTSLVTLSIADNPLSGDFIVSLPTILRSISTLKYLNSKPVTKALSMYKVYNPKTLKESTLEYLTQNLTSEQLEELAESGHPAFDLLPLTPE